MDIWNQSQSYLCIRFSYARLVHYTFIFNYWYILKSYWCFKVHVSKDSTVADHCRTYALSYPQDNDYTTVCYHEHDSKCDRCELLPKLFRELGQLLAVLTVAQKNETRSMKSHNQNAVRDEILKKLDARAVLMVMDWAMKFLARKFSESQSDWFLPEVNSVYMRSDNAGC